MPTELTFITAFLVGLFGSVHCIGMCGGIISALTLGVSGSIASRKRVLTMVLNYNFGRISSYMAAGVLAAVVGQQIADSLFLKYGQTVMAITASGFMLVMGLYVAGWWSGLIVLEKIGSHVWRYIEPLGRHLLPVKRARQAFLLGLIWGWLPCGLVYTALIWSLSAGSAANGAWLMLGFGLGTLPVLVALGGFASSVRVLLQKPSSRRIAGAIIIVFAFISLFWLILPLIQQDAAPDHGGSMHQHGR